MFIYDFVEQNIISCILPFCVEFFNREFTFKVLDLVVRRFLFILVLYHTLNVCLVDFFYI